MRAGVEVTAVEGLLAAGEVAIAVLIAEDAHIPVDRAEDVENVGLDVVHDDLVDVLARRHLDLALDDTLQPLNKMLFIESNPIPVKWAVSEMGLMRAHIRLPLTPFLAKHHEDMRVALRTAGVALEEVV